MKSKLVKIYELREGGQLCVNATGINESGDFYLKSPAKQHGRILPPSVSDEDIGKAVRYALSNCD